MSTNVCRPVGPIIVAVVFDDVMVVTPPRSSVIRFGNPSASYPNPRSCRPVNDGTTSTTRIYNYSYDKRGRVTSTWIDNVLEEEYGYDVNGVRLDADALWDAQDRLVYRAGWNYAYGDNGDLTGKWKASGESASYTYDTFGNLVEATVDGQSVSYELDAKGRRIGRSVDTVLVSAYLYRDGAQLAAELTPDGQVRSRFVYGSWPHVPDYMVRDNKVYRLVTDHLGSVHLVVDASTGTVLQQLDYDTWGNVVADTNPGFQPFGFAGGLYDSVTGLVRFGAPRNFVSRKGRTRSAGTRVKSVLSR
jgi:YD repeat-containing protein